MKFIVKIILLVILTIPGNLAAQPDDCSGLDRKQILNLIKLHPELKYELKFRCFKKFSQDDIYMIYGENDSLKTIINNYYLSVNNVGIVLMSLAVIDLVAFPFVLKQSRNSDTGGAIFMATLVIPLAVVGIIVHLSTPKKGDLYHALWKYHIAHQ